MRKVRRDSRGFTLIAALLLTVLLSAVAVGLLYLVSNEERMGGNDLEGNLAYYGAESGIENLTAQLSTLYQTSQSPTPAAITALAAPANWPTNVTGSNITSMNYSETITWPAYYSNGLSNGLPCPNPQNLATPPPCGSWNIVGSGSDQGMVASIIPFNLQVIATRASTAGEATTNAGITPTGASVNLTRTVEVAMLPAFEFGIFCEDDCDYFAGPNFNFGGRVHSNLNLFLASGSSLTFTDKIAAVGQVVTTQLENGWPTSNQYTGSVYVPSAAGACPGAPGSGPATNCQALTAGSWTGGYPPPPSPATCTADCAGAANGAWGGISKTTFAGFITNGSTGATKLQLPFVQSDAVGAIEIIRKPQATDTPTLSGSRLYSEASIRILLADTQADLHPERGLLSDGQDVQLGVTAVPSGGPTTSVKFSYASSPADYMYYGVATAGTNGWVDPTNPATGTAYNWTSWPLLSEITSSPANTAAAAPNTAHVWLRVEYLNNVTGAWTGVTTQWLGYGFGRPYDMPPTAPYVVGGANPVCPQYPTFPAAQCYNPISPAILILQQLQQGLAATSGYDSGTGATAGNWIPINFYDSREGEPRDVTTRPSNTTTTKGQTVYTPCSPIGVMNSVELDVGNLWLWLQGVAPYTAGSGSLVSNSTYNGYILYFSDRRGMIPDPNPVTSTGLYNGITGMAGLEDTINGTSATGVPDGKLEPATYYSYSPEDVNEDSYFDNWGEKNLGAGFNLTGSYTGTPYFPIPANASTVSTNQMSCNSDTQTNTVPSYNESYPPGAGTLGATAFLGNPQNNVVFGPRHSLRLVDGGMNSKGVSYLPQPPVTTPPTSGDGFTVGSEEPVYVFGDYNTGIADPLWGAAGTTTTPHSAASIIADSVTLLSNPPSGAASPTANVGWTDVESFLQPGVAANRPGNTSYYRMAIAAGKSIPFPEPAWATADGLKDFGTDGGMHNFLRYIEDRGANGAIVNYSGSLISMYYSQYHTGVFKCCNTVYGAPTRNYFFDTQFLNPNFLPPGTPMFQDVVSLGFHQNFTPQ